MKLRPLTTILASWVICLWLVTAATTAPNFSPAQQRILREVSPAEVIYLGETHDSASDHSDQIDIINYLHRSNQQIAIGLEMFQKPFQGVIDQYLAGQISETELVAQTEYQKRWGWPWENYAPLLRLAKKQQISVIALNTPTEVLRKVAKGGLESLQTADFQYIPPAAEIDKSNLAYRDLLLAAYREHQAQALATSKEFDRFYTAQLLWDETMAANAAQFRQQHPRTQLIVIAGQGHILYGYGIPRRVARRLKQVQQKIVILSSTETWKDQMGDYLFRSLALQKS
jgi:uncharacterized iron-regulated protein